MKLTTFWLVNGVAKSRICWYDDAPTGTYEYEPFAHGFENHWVLYKNKKKP